MTTYQLLKPDVPFVGLHPAPDQPTIERFSSNIGMDPVLGPGGWVRGATYLLSGGPGTGKSTLLLKAAAAVADSNPIAYITAEESIGQVQDRAKRLNVQDASIQLAETADYRTALSTLTPTLKRGLLVVDSIQRMYDPSARGEPASTLQVRKAVRAFIAFAKTNLTTVVMICQETKGGRGAGPNTLFHDVDVVLQLYINDNGQRRLFAHKNRFGPTFK